MAQSNALVTGAGHRLGAAIALALAEAGAPVAIHYGRSDQEAEAVRQQILQKGGQAVTLQADLADPNDVDGLMERAADALEGTVRTLVNSAAIFQPGGVRDTTRKSWSRHLAINLTAPTRLMGAFARQFDPGPSPTTERAPHPPRLEGRIINIIDQRIRRPQPGHLAYSTAKAGLWHATQVAAAELAPTITVNAIGPGPILPAPGDPREKFEAIAAATPMQHPGSPNDITAALMFLLSQTYITGEMLCVDGGEHL
ncbi:MAG: SDR family oxidoreductase [Magnetococcales bacterium]|nr:SDR family oxidoreductase [Magnetococcales bacterium]